MFRSTKRAPEPAVLGASDIVRLRRMLINVGNGAPAQSPALKSGATPELAPDATTGDEDSVAESKRLVSEQRGIAEALLHELTEIERRVECQARVVEANRAYLAARQSADEIVAAVEGERARLTTSQIEYEACAAKRHEAETAVATAQAELANATLAVEELQRLLEKARGRLAERTNALGELEALAQHAVAQETQAGERRSDAQDALSAGETQLAAAQEKAQASKEHTDRLRDDLLAMGTSPTYDHVRQLARHIADFEYAGG